MTAGASPPAVEAGTLLTVDLAALAANWRLLAARAAPAECAAVVKADAYGLGIEAAVPALARAGCRTFFVAHLAEGRRARAAAPNAAVYVLNGVLPGAAEVFVREGLRPVLGSRAELEEWAALVRAAGRPLPAALHVDTGMNRLGLPVEEALALAGDPLLAQVAPALLVSHLVAAEVPDDAVNARQLAAFAALREAFPGMPGSLANSSGLFLEPRPVHDLARPGYALYGGNPTPGRPNPMRPVVRLEARIVQVRDVEAGARAGYNGTWTAPGSRRLATLSVGYADGFPRAASGTDAKAEGGIAAGAALVGGVRCPFAGTVSMDLIILDVTEAGEAAFRGAPAVLIGDGIEIDEVGHRAGTIGYEVLTGLGTRYARHYIEG